MQKYMNEIRKTFPPELPGQFLDIIYNYVIIALLKCIHWVELGSQVSDVVQYYNTVIIDLSEL